MFHLKVLQAEFGDCLLLEFGAPVKPAYVLIDGGPPGTYDGHLRAELLKLARRDLALVVLSHVDNDHIVGLLDMTSELKNQRANHQEETVTVRQLWHNSFATTIGHGNNTEARLRTMMKTAAATMVQSGVTVLGIGEGDMLRRDALLLGIPLNHDFQDGLICVDNTPSPVMIDNLTLQVVGPTQANLEELQSEWEAWLDKHEGAGSDPLLAANADRSVPNLSSIMLLAKADSKTVLLTGDGRSDHLLAGLKMAGLLAGDSTLKVDVLKLPHHGSDRNMTRKFFRTVVADTYVASANGKDGNPDLATLIWLVEAAKEQSRRPRIVVTNETPSTQKLLDEYPPAEYGYELQFLAKGDHCVTLELST